MEKLNFSKKSLRKFGITMGVAFFIIGLILIVKHKQVPYPVLLISAGWFISASIMPELLKPLYIIWMRLAFILSWINTRIILFIMFYLIFTPIGIVIRLFGTDLLKRKIDKAKSSYWVNPDKKAFNKLSYEKQF